MLYILFQGNLYIIENAMPKMVDRKMEFLICKSITNKIGMLQTSTEDVNIYTVNLFFSF